ncbi:MAG: hypothetical protein EOO73_16700 [Myxococcales bacterium]|nr:MAG: hypothetical protein EOO73_16700 [Myxococcales bacterium]
MSELRRHGRELLEASRRERTPSAERKQRILEKLLESAAQTTLAAREPPPLAERLSPRTKALVLVVLVAAIVVGMWAASR